MRMGAAARRWRETSYPIGAAVSLEELELDPHPVLSRLREREPVSWLPALRGWLVTGRDLALQTMRDAENFTVDDPRFSTGQVVGPSMLTLDGAAHGRHRDPFARPFRHDSVRERFTTLVEAETERLIDAIEMEGTRSCVAASQGHWPRGLPPTHSVSRVRTPPRCSAGMRRSSTR